MHSGHSGSVPPALHLSLGVTTRVFSLLKSQGKPISPVLTVKILLSGDLSESEVSLVYIASSRT